MRVTTTNILILFLVLLSASSCISRKKLTYLQYARDGQDEMAVKDVQTSITPESYKLMPYDILFVRVITPDPQWSEIFNVMATGQSGGVTTESASLLGYTVNSDGNIEIPYVGKVAVAGKTLAEIKTELDLIFKKYLNDAAITVRLVNNFVSIIGEVNNPGRYPLTKDRLSVFEALSLAGDLNQFSDRRKIQLIRSSEYGPIVKEFSLIDRSIFTSEFYYIMPNDVIYATPMKGRSFRDNSSVASVILSSTGTLFGLITTLFVIFNL